MNRLLAIVSVLVIATCAYGLPPANNEVTIQPSEIRNWTCDYGVAVDTLISFNATLRAGTDADCIADDAYVCDPTTLINTPNVSGTTAAFTITPADKLSGNVYQVDIVVEDSVGQRFACNGKVTVKTMVVTY